MYSHKVKVVPVDLRYPGGPRSLTSELPLVAGAVLLETLIGTTLGIRLAAPAVLKVLGAVLVIAGLKLIGVY